MSRQVAFISQFADFVGGGEHSLFDLMRYLPAAWQPLLLTPTAGALSSEAMAAGIEVAYLPMPKLGLASIPALFSWSAWLRKARPAILHANNSRAAVYAGLAARLHGVPMLFHCRISEPDPPLDGLIARLASRIVCNSCAVAERFAAWPGKAQVIYNGVSLLEPPVRDKPWGAESILLFAGRLSEEKQPDEAVRLFAELADDFPGLHLAMAGGDDPHDPAYSDGVRRAAEGLRCTERIHWLGHCDAMVDWYAVADLLVVPSKHEGFGRVIVEAMGCGVPVAAYAVGGIPEVLQNDVQGVLVPAGDEGAMLDALQRMFSDPAARQAMGEAGRLRAAEFRPEQHAAAVAHLYAELVGGGR